MSNHELGTYNAYIDGEARQGIETFEVYNPATNEQVATVAEGGEPTVSEAVTVAEDAFAEWRAVNPAERGRILRELGEAIREHADELARIETIENGRPLGFSKMLVRAAATYFDYYAGVTDKLEGETIPVPGPHLDYTRREPLGVTGHIVPWNVSLKLGARSIAPALAAGNTVVAKPAPEAPVSLIRFAQLLTETTLPDGVLNVVPGDGPRTGAALTSDERVRGIAFTGSRETGKEVIKSAADNVVPVAPELGGKSPNIVFPDADLERAADDTVKAFFNAGQICYAPTRVFIHEGIYDEFTEMLAKRAEGMSVGVGMEGNDIGPLITREARDRVAEYVDNAVADGGHVLAGGDIPREEGNFYTPTLIENVDDDAPISCDEVFGPVLTLYEFGSEEEAIHRANDTRYGLYGVVWTNELARAHRMTEAIEAGTVVVNEFPVTFPQAPFGGYKESGIGREHGKDALEHYTQVKNVVINLE